MSPAAAPAPSRFLVTATPPTTNGDLHLGHLAGPYLAADVFARSRRMLGERAVYVSSADDHQTYLVTTAERLGVDPRDLAARSTEAIRRTLAAAQVRVDEFSSPDEDHCAAVQGFFADLHRRGRLETRTWSFGFDPASGRHLLEAFSSGVCPSCLATTSGAVCEGCGHPNDPGSLLYADAGTAPTRRDVEILVLPLERHRAAIADVFARHRATMRPHVLRFVDEMLAGPLPDFPVSYPAQWGVPVTVPGLPALAGQVFNVWAEMLPGLIHTTDRALPGADAWSAASGWTLVQFLGFDNAFYFSMAHLALLLADGDRLQPTAIVTNEFALLDGEKFSTSRGHLLWAREVIERHGADAVRFHLALHSPEHQRCDVTEDALAASIDRVLHDPLRTVRAAAARATPGPPDAATGAVLAAYRTRMASGYALETFSLRQLAAATADLLALLAARAEADPELAAHGLAAIADLADPLLPGLCADLRGDAGTEHAGRR